MKAIGISFLSVAVGLLTAFLIGPLVGAEENLSLSVILVIVAIAMAVRLNGDRRLISPLLLYIGIAIVMLYLGTVAMSLGYERVFTIPISAYPAELAMSFIAICVGAYLVEWYTHPSVHRCASRYLEKSIDLTLGEIPRWILANGYLLLGIALTALLFIDYGLVRGNVTSGESYAVITRASDSFSIKSVYLLGLTMFLPIGSLARFAAAMETRNRSDYVLAAGTAGLVLLASTLAGVRHTALDYMIWTVILLLMLGFKDLPRLRILLVSGLVSLVILFTVVMLRNPEMQSGSFGAALSESARHVFERVSISQAEGFNFQLDYIPDAFPYFDGLTYFDRLKGTVPGVSPEFNLATWISTNNRSGVDLSDRPAPFIPPTFAGEAYANFGLLGMLLGSAIWGAFLHGIWKIILATPRRADYAIFASILITNLGRSAILSAYSPIYNSIIAAVLILGPGILFYARSSRYDRATSAQFNAPLGSGH